MTFEYFLRDTQAIDYSNIMTKKMRDISQPLFEHTKITSFSYLRFNKDGTVLNLTTDERWVQFRVDQRIKYKILFREQLPDAKHNTPYTYLWPKNIDDPLLGALHQYNIWNGCNIYIANETSVEVFSFASSVENENIENFYINNLDLLKTFILYFKEQLNELPDIHTKKNLFSTELILPELESGKKTASTLARDAILNQTKMKRVYLSDDIYLTPKELAACSNLMRGRSIKSIAKTLGISPRTVETHLNHAKFKTGHKTTTKFIDYILDNQWIFDTLLSRT